MQKSDLSSFLVSNNKESTFILIKGRASFINASTFKKFIDTSLKKMSKYFVIDFKDCSGMDSTFLGIVAWLGMEIKKSPNKSFLIVRNLNSRNSELFHNLGLQNFITTESSINTQNQEPEKEYSCLDSKDKIKASDILIAHKTLVEASKKNASIFKDVIEILESKKQKN